MTTIYFNVHKPPANSPTAGHVYIAYTDNPNFQYSLSLVKACENANIRDCIAVRNLACFLGTHRGEPIGNNLPGIIEIQ